MSRRVNKSLSNPFEKITEKEKEVITLQELIDKYLKMCIIAGKAEGTVKEYAMQTRLFFEFVVKCDENLVADVDLITHDVIANYIESMYERKLSKNTIAIKISVLNNLFEYGNKKGYVTTNPMIGFNRPTIAKTDKVELKTKDVEEMKQYCVDRAYSFTWLRRAFTIMLLSHTGMRVTEMCDMKVADVDLNDMTMHIRGTKSFTSDRVIPITKELAKWTKIYLEERGNIDSEYLLVTLDNKRISKRTIEREITNISQSVGLNGVSPHRFRDYYISELVRKGVHPNVIAKLVGHSNTSTIMVYFNANMDDMKKAIEKLG